MAELLKEIQSVEGLIKLVAHAYAAEKGSAPKSKDKKKQKTVLKLQAHGVLKKPNVKVFLLQAIRTLEEAMSSLSEQD